MIGTKTLRSIGKNIRIYRLCLQEFNYYRQNLQTLLFLPTNLIDFMPIIKLGNSSVTFFQQFAYNYLQCGSHSQITPGVCFGPRENRLSQKSTS